MHAQELVGIYALLHQTPILYSVFVLLFFIVGILPLIKRITEGESYVCGWAGLYGDPALIGSVCVGIDLLQRTGKAIPWLNSIHHQYLLIIPFILVGIGTQCVISFIVARQPGRPVNLGTSERIYHNFIIVPTLVLLLLDAFIRIILYGTANDEYKFWGLFAIWLVLAFNEVITGRVNEREWLHAKGYRFVRTFRCDSWFLH